MTCELAGPDWRRQLRRKAVRQDVPLTGMLELTRRCNFRCGHCYAGPAREARGELDTAGWTAVLNEAAAAGCLELTFTGGEPMLRPDFADLYRQARRLGLEVTVFTNAALADEAVAALFAEWPPRRVDVTVYGLTENVSRTVTGVPGACDRQWEGLRRLREAGVPVTLKVLATPAMAGEIPAIRARAREWGLRLGVAVEVSARRDGAGGPLACRLAPEEAARLEAEEPGWAERLRSRIEHRKADGRRYPCAAGQYGFFVDAEGGIQPCLALQAFRRPFRPGRFVEDWKAVRDAARATVRFDTGDADALNYQTSTCPAMAEWQDAIPEAAAWERELAARRMGFLQAVGRHD